MSIDVRLIAVVDAAVLGSRDPVDAALSAQAGGATMVQLRMKHAPAAEVHDVTRRLVSALDVPVYVNDRVDVALAAGAAGVHIGADDLPLPRVQAMAPPAFGIGVSVGSVAEARAVAPAPVTYWSLGSFFRTAHKADAGEPIGTEGFRRLAAFAPAGVPVIAIGGIDRHNVSEVIAAGARGVAVIGAVFARDDIEGAARVLRTAVDQALSAGTRRGR